MRHVRVRSTKKNRLYAAGLRHSLQMRHILTPLVLAGLVSACSSDVSRFSADPFANPFQARSPNDPPATASIDKKIRQLSAMPTGSVSTQPLPSVNQPLLKNTRHSLTSGAVAGANYPQLAPNAARNPSVPGVNAGWSAVGGTPLTLQQGDTVAGLSSRYGVPASAIMAVNGFSHTSQAQPGQVIIIPAYNAHIAKATPAPPPASALPPKAQATRPPVPSTGMLPGREIAAEKMRAPAAIQLAQAAPGKPARAVGQPVETEAERRAAAKLKQLRASDNSKAPDDLVDRPEKARPEPVKKAEAAPKIAKARPPKAQPVVEDTETTASIPDSKPVPKPAPRVADTQPEKPAPAETASDESGPSFRWPAQGRIINGYGARGTGGANDGINIALPEGTPVRAAEGGTVVHADDALKGYGKLVLIRHPNGYVSVYAHNGELKVKRGESVKRGQIVATSGQSGNVTSPQLHFEIRKGATPVDPTKYLAAN